MKAYQFKITLNDTHPPIWRRFTVPSTYSFSRFIFVVNTVMGWDGSHLSMVSFNQLHIDLIDDPDDDIFGPNEYLDAADYQLEELVENVKSFRYLYDFGDCWDHKIELEKIIEDSPDPHPVLLKFKGECPWEDCGGVYGYEHMLNVLSDPQNEEYEETNEWTGGSLPPYYPSHVNAVLSRMSLPKAETKSNHKNQKSKEPNAGRSLELVSAPEKQDINWYDPDDDFLDDELDDEDWEDVGFDETTAAKFNEFLSDDDVRQLLVDMVATGIYVHVIDLLHKNAGLSEKEIYKYLELDEDTIESIMMARRVIQDQEQSKPKNKKNKKKKK